MPVREKNPIKGTETTEERAKGWIDRLDEFGRKHARIILTLSAGLIILIVLVVANAVYRRSMADRISRELALADGIEQIKKLKERYSGEPQLAQIMATLGHRYYEDGRLEEAKREYDEFLHKFADHPLAVAVQRARQSLEENVKFETEQKDAMQQLPSLSSHPVKDIKLQRDLARLRDRLEELRKDPGRKEEGDAVAREIERRQASPLAAGPLKLPHPGLVFEIKDKEGKINTFRVELFEDEAPDAVASLIELAEKKYFEGQKLNVIPDERLQMPPKQAGVVDYALPFEPTRREGDVGSLIMVRQGAHNQAAEFQILLKSVPDPGEVTVAGIVASESDRQIVRQLKAEDTIQSVRAERKRAHDYKPRTVKP
ncbi:MAG: peptidylprolyl isomerase [Planctomycetes bacterium]|nr:peptidylprolyl isomerase [Planctomycetota bacterium]